MPMPPALPRRSLGLAALIACGEAKLRSESRRRGGRQSQRPGGDVPRDVAGGQRRDDRLLERAVPPAVLAQLVLVLGGDVDLERAVAVEIGEVDRVFESRRSGVDQRLL